jgi:hypothetical protein
MQRLAFWVKMVHVDKSWYVLLIYCLFLANYWYYYWLPITSFVTSPSHIDYHFRGLSDFYSATKYSSTWHNLLWNLNSHQHFLLESVMFVTEKQRGHLHVFHPNIHHCIKINAWLFYHSVYFFIRVPEFWQIICSFPSTKYFLTLHN